eukprot:TRINITY_DN11760_c0_g1_i4.p2 TRINITY_DN11760_c0_g1~~TRINITY_DN11760_c0_g1_i4.p2  ORF type:complete len:522 (+),score=116.02 TRINITY_DN11760_c0_g1_i4:1811-3376(+)
MQNISKPWVEQFGQFLWEISNETWNRMFAPWTFSSVTTTDAVTGRVYSGGQVQGLWLDHVVRTLESSPYWTDEVKAKFRYVMGGWATDDDRQSHNGYGTQAEMTGKQGSFLTIAGYNGGWDEGEPPVSPVDPAFFEVLSFTAQNAHPLASAMNMIRTNLTASGYHNYQPGTYEAGPGYHLNGLNNDVMNASQVEAESQTMKSQAGGASTLDAFLVRAACGFGVQNFFTFSRNRDYWTSHAPLVSGGQAYPPWSALTMYNVNATGDFLSTQYARTPTWTLNATKKRPAVPNARLMSVYATRNSKDYSVFVISKKLDKYPVADSDGFTPVTINLPFIPTSTTTLEVCKMDADPRLNNLDANNVQIKCQPLSLLVIDNPFVINSATGADDRGVGPGSIYLYRFTNVQTQAPTDTVQVRIARMAVEAVAPVNASFYIHFDQSVKPSHVQASAISFSGSAITNTSALTTAVTRSLINGYTSYMVSVAGMQQSGNVIIQVDNSVIAGRSVNVTLAYDGADTMQWRLA